LAAEPLPGRGFLAARIGDDVPDGEEVRLVVELGDERELVLDGITLALRHTVGPAPVRTLVRESAQVPGRVSPGGTSSRGYS